jgi:hypothetical protein
LATCAARAGLAENAEPAGNGLFGPIRSNDAVNLVLVSTYKCYVGSPREIRTAVHGYRESTAPQRLACVRFYLSLKSPISLMFFSVDLLALAGG